MRRRGTAWPAAALLTTVVLVPGCAAEPGAGSSAPSAASVDPGQSSSVPSPSGPVSSTGSPTKETPSTWSQLAILDITGAGGRVSDRLSPLDTPAGVDAFVARLDAPHARREVRRAVRTARIPDGHRLMGAVVAVSCDPPERVTVSLATRPPTVTAPRSPSDLQCLAAITSIALVSVREGLAG